MSLNLDLSHEAWMALAIEEAQKAATADEVPVGAVLVHNNQLIAKAHNQPIHLHDPSAHAEIQVLRQAAEFLGNYRLPQTSLYVTLEPCLMCCGAIFHARVSNVYFGAFDSKTGCAGSVMNLFENTQLNHHCKVHGGISEQACVGVLKEFFKNKRQAKL
jgi:tRNA(adenine34) deaminase